MKEETPGSSRSPTPREGRDGSRCVSALGKAQSLTQGIGPGDVLPYILDRLQHGESPAAEARDAIPPELVRLLADYCASSNDAAASRLIDQALRNGLGLSGLLLGLIGAAADLLGEDWKNDTRDFTEVTVGSWRLHALVCDYAPRLMSLERQQGMGLELLIAPAPGEAHTLGALVIAEFFRDAGWTVSDQAAIDANALTNMVRRQHFDAVGLSVSTDDTLVPLPQTIARLRRASLNPELVVIVGGSILTGRPDLCRSLDADAICTQAATAPAFAEALVQARCEATSLIE